jgi:hypothetical protein
VKIDLNRPMKDILASLSQPPVTTPLLLRVRSWSRATSPTRS